MVRREIKEKKMKKRLRKKLRVGEFTDLVFTLSGKLNPMDEAGEDAFFDRFFDLMEDNGCCLSGTIGLEDFDLAVITGPVNTDNEARREAILEGLKNFPEIAEFDASVLEK